MKKLIQPVDFIISLLKKMDHFNYLPNYGNLGDGFIATATYVLFDKNKLNYTILKQPSESNTNIVFGGGGYFCGLYPYKHIKELLNNKQLKNIVFLPNTFYNCDDLISLFDERFTIFCRDERSYNYVQSFKTKAKIYLAHDMAFSWQERNLKLLKKEPEDAIPLGKRYTLWNYIYPLCKNIQNIKVGKQTYKVSYLLREDKEQVNGQKNPGCSFDLSGAYLGNFMHKPTTYWLLRLFRSTIQCSDIIVTNRLHISIMASKLGKEVILLDNSYGKVLSIWQMSMQDIKNVHLIKNCQNLEKEVEQILQNVPLMHTANDKEFLKLNPVPEAQLYT